MRMLPSPLARVLVHLALVALSSALGLGCAAPDLPRSTTDASTATTVRDTSAFTLGPGDLVHVTVYGQPELSSPPTGFRIAPDGTLSLPLVGAVSVDGLAPAAASRALEAGLAAWFTRPAVGVAVLEYASRRFYVFGEVERPGPYPMDRPVTALEALSHGGKLLPSARRDEVVIIRPSGDADVEVIAFDARTPGPDGLVQVRPDDLVFVGQSGVGRFTESVTPYLQGLGYSVNQVASLALAYDRLYKN